MKKIIIGIIAIFIIVGGYKFYSTSKKKEQIKTQEKIIEDNSSMNSGNINEENWNVKPKDLEVKPIDIIGERPQFELENLAGEKIKLSDYKGKKVFINFWATWCPPCEDEMLAIQKLHNKQDNNIEIITIDVGESTEKVQEYMKEHKYNFTVLLDKDSQVALKYKARYLPVSMLINKEGQIEKYKNGPMDYKEMENFIK